jgi:predicted PurR-regulated permease PerM
MIVLSVLISTKKEKLNKKIFFIIAYLLAWLFIGGVVGILASSAIYAIAYSFLSDFKKDY